MPSLLRVSMSQHLGAPAVPVVKKGDSVLRGQLIGEPAGFISASVHAPTSGTVKNIALSPTLTGAMAQCLEIEPDGNDQWVDGLVECGDWKGLDSAAIASKVADGGISGMGGAGFPTHVKLSPPPEKTIDTLILNGAECEPYLTADHRIMLEDADSIIRGAMIIQHVLGAKNTHVAIEENKPDAIRAMQEAVDKANATIAVSVLKCLYPQGAEKQQIYSITGREVPAGGLPMDVGCLVENVATCSAIYESVVNGKPLTERVLTLTGAPVNKPGNIRVRLGTTFADIIEFRGGLRADACKVIAGGPMMGPAQHSLDIGVTKTTSGILCLPPSSTDYFSSMPCISCGRCVTACPMRLMPNELSRAIEAEDYEEGEALHVMDCIECGCCAYVCPAHRPMVQHMKQGKARVVRKRKKKQ